MARYFFHVNDSAEMLDSEGVELRGPDQAGAMAIVASGEALKDLGRRFWANPEWRMWVTDENGAKVCSLTISAERGA